MEGLDAAVEGRRGRRSPATKRRFRLALITLLALGLAFATANCYRYAAVKGESGADLSQGTPIQVQLGEPVSVDLAKLTVRETTRVRGEFVTWEERGSRGERTLVLSALWLESVTGSGRQARGETVRIPENAIGRLEKKEVSFSRTALVVVPIGLAAALLPTVLEAGSGTTGDGGGPPGQQ